MKNMNKIAYVGPEDEDNVKPGTLTRVHSEYHSSGGYGVVVERHSREFFHQFQVYSVLYEGKVIKMYRYEFSTGNNDTPVDVNKNPFVAMKGIWRKV